jgi:hypothetical protein
MVSDKKLFLSLFLIQVIASFLVFVGHYTATTVSYHSWSGWEEMLNKLSRYGTVLLAILTGFFTAHSFGGKKASGSQYFLGKLLYIFIPFLIAGVVYHWLKHHGLPLTANDILNIFLGKTGVHLYFIFMLCQYYVFAYLVRNLITPRYSLAVMLLFLCIQYLFITYSKGLFGMGIRFWLPFWIFTLYLGHLLYWFRESVFGLLDRHKWLLVPIGGFAAGSLYFFLTSNDTYTANHLIFVVSTFAWLVAGAWSLMRVAEYLPIRFQKGLTFYIYLTHNFFITMSIRLYIDKYGKYGIFSDTLSSITFMMLLYAVTFAFSLVASLVMDRLAKQIMPKPKEQPVAPAA